MKVGIDWKFRKTHILPHIRILAHMRMEYPVRVWDNIMGVPYEYTCMIATCTPGINFCIQNDY